MERLSGVITVVQEGRFRLATEDGRSILFTLHHGAPVEPQDLPRLIGPGLVNVVYSTPKNRRALTAHQVRPRGRA